jgi:hypothetical protein
MCCPAGQEANNFHSQSAAKKGGNRPPMNLAANYDGASTKFVDFSKKQKAPKPRRGVDGKQVYGDDGRGDGQ